MGICICCLSKDKEEPPKDSCTKQMPTSSSSGTFRVPNNQNQNIEDDYEIINKPIGSGAFGTVRIAIWRETQEKRALKYVNKANEDMVMLEREVSVNFELDHPNIAKLLNLYEDRLFVYMVLELCQGHDVDTLHGAGKEPCSVANTAFVMDSLLYALEYMQKGIAHRDVKPANLVLKHENIPLEHNCIKLIDFGLAKRFSKGEKSLKTQLGSPLYLPPEIWSGQYYDGRCDVWSAGVLMFELLSVGYPYAGHSIPEQKHLVLNDELSFEDAPWEQIDDSTKDFVRLLMTKDIDKRIRAKAAHDHDWIQRNAPKVTDETMALKRSMSKNMESFSAKSRFEKVAISLVAHLLDDSEIEDLNRAFKSFDTNGDGTLSLQEIERAFKETNTQADLEDFFQKVDFNHNSQIEYSTFIAAMLDQKYFHRREHLWRAFKAIDQENKNVITVDQLTEAFKNLDQTDAPVTHEEIQSIMQKTDTNQDGMISFEEFVALICGTPTSEANGATAAKTAKKLNDRHHSLPDK